MKTSPDNTLDFAWITRELGDVDGLSLQFEDTVDSTNTWVLDEQRAIASGTVLFAEMQVAGRGRRGRHWHSPQAQNVYATLAWDWQAPLERLGGLPLAVGVGLVTALEQLGVRDLALKWPNDVLADNKKMAGILIESSTYAGQTTRLAIGVGVNVRMSRGEIAPDTITQPWTSVSEAAGEPVSREQVAISLARTLHQTLAQFTRLGWAGFSSTWYQYDVLRGRRVYTSGASTLEGTAIGVDASGALLLDIDGTIHPVHSGEVSVRPAAG